MFFTTPAPMSPYSPDYYPRYHPGVSFVVNARATQYLAEQRERAWALHYQQQPTPNALLAEEYDEFPDQQRMMRVLRTCRLQDEEKLGYIMARQHAKMRQANCTARHTAEMQRSRIREWQYSVALHAHIEEEQAFARQRADAEKFLAEAETNLSGFLPPDQEPYLGTFQPFDLPDTPVPTSTSKVPIDDEPFLKDVIEDCVMAENRRTAEYRFEVRDTLQSILDCLPAGTSTEVPIEYVPNRARLPQFWEFSPQVTSSTSKVPVQDEPLPKDVIEDYHVMTENRRMAEYRFEVRDTLQSILDCLSAGTSTEVPIEHVPVPSIDSPFPRSDLVTMSVE